MGRQQLVCGAVTGAIMALGIKYGKALHDDESKKKQTYDKTVEFFNEFKKIHGSVNCRELLAGLDLNDPEDHKRIVESGMFDTHCRKYVEDAVGIVEKMFSAK